MIYGVPLAGTNGEVKRNGRDYGNHCKLEIYTGNCFGYGKIVVREEWRYHLFNKNIDRDIRIDNFFFFFFACNCCTNYVFISFLLTIRQYFFILDFIFTWRFIRDCYTWDFIERFIFIDKYLRYYIFFQVTFELFWNQLKCIEHKGKTLKNR